ncbi:MAG: hypothetical protein Fur0039_11430 [Rhodocyclaceae bacterium]
MLAAALCASLALHALVLLALGRTLSGAADRPRDRPPGLEARLRPVPGSEPGRLPPALLKNTLDESRPSRPERPAAARRPAAALRAEALGGRPLAEARSRLSSTLFYPPEAVAQGLEGEVVLLLELSDDGRIETASVASGSGHAILDEAALAAVRRLGSLPPVAGRAVLFPVRFRLE